MQVLVENWYVFPAGLWVTIQVALQAIALGVAVGTLVGLGLLYGPAIVRWLLRVYVDIIRGLPLLVTIFAIFYGLPMLRILLPRTSSVVLALGLFAAAHMAEIVRGAVSSIPRGQMEAAKAIGLVFWQRMGYVILPQATRRALPPSINLSVELIKGTSLVSLVGVADLLLSARHAMERTTQPLPFYFMLAVIYFCICFALSRLGAYMERRFAYGAVGSTQHRGPLQPALTGR